MATHTTETVLRHHTHQPTSCLVQLIAVADWPFEIGPLDVRDYECDLQGVVNNAVYLNYLEHARHCCLQELGFDFAALHAGGCDLVVTRTEIDYLRPLSSGDRFLIRTRIGRASRIRFAFDQVIVRAGDGQVMVEARIVGTGILTVGERRRPGLPPALLAKLDEAEADYG